jgi:hypothetical protein
MRPVGARLLTRSLAVAGTLAACLAGPAQAQSGAAQRAALKIFQDYVTDGRIDPCRHTSAELKLAHDNIPPDIEQYAADYPAAIEAAIEARARGDCSGTKPAAGLIPRATSTPTAAPTPKPTPIPTAIPTKTVVPDPPGPVQAAATATATVQSAPDVALERVAAAQPSNSAPTPVLLLGLLVAAFACLALFFVTMKRLGVGEERFAGVSHSWREYRWRMGGVWDDFRDWLRIGR